MSYSNCIKLLAYLSLALFYACQYQVSKTKEINATSKTGNQDFELFYNQFIHDSAFQMNHIQWPLQGTYLDYSIEKNWSMENWNLITWNYQNEKSTEYDSISVVETDSTAHLSYNCLDCGFSFEMQFKKINQEWMLVQRQENNF